MDWHDRAFADLTTAELYAIVALRERVFVVEQRCAYLDADGLDPACRHVYATDGADGIVAYLRVVPAGAHGAQARIGRVVVAPSHRGTGLARQLMHRGFVAARADARPIRIAAQAHLTGFYAQLGFVGEGAPFDEDGIPHVNMLRAPRPHV